MKTEKIVENVLDNFYVTHPQGNELLMIDLEELIRQQQLYIETLEEENRELKELTVLNKEELRWLN